MPEVRLGLTDAPEAHGIAAVVWGQPRNAVRHCIEVSQNRLVVHTLQGQKTSPWLQSRDIAALPESRYNLLERVLRCLRASQQCSMHCIAVMPAVTRWYVGGSQAQWVLGSPCRSAAWHQALRPQTEQRGTTCRRRPARRCSQIGICSQEITACSSISSLGLPQDAKTTTLCSILQDDIYM